MTSNCVSAYCYVAVFISTSFFGGKQSQLTLEVRKLALEISAVTRIVTVRQTNTAKSNVTVRTQSLPCPYREKMPNLAVYVDLLK